MNKSIAGFDGKVYGGRKFSVKDLCANTPVARTTFYSYYNNIDEVKCDIEDKIIRGLLEVTESVSRGNIPDMDFMVFLDAIQIYIEENWEWIYEFVVKQPNHRFIDKWKQAICGNFQKRYPKKQSIQNYGLISEVVASATIGAYTYWMKYPDRVKKDDMKGIIKKRWMQLYKSYKTEHFIKMCSVFGTIYLL